MTYSLVRASDHPANTLDFDLVKGSFGTAVIIRSTKQAYEIPVPQISFASDGFNVLSVPAKSDFARMLTAMMANETAAKLDPDQWQKLWQIFRYYGATATGISSRSPPAFGA